MQSPTQSKKFQKIPEATINLPLGSLRYLSQYPREKKIIVEISTEDLRRVNDARTLDEIINEARMDYAKGNYTKHTNVQSLLTALES